MKDIPWPHHSLRCSVQQLALTGSQLLKNLVLLGQLGENVVSCLFLVVERCLRGSNIRVNEAVKSSHNADKTNRDEERESVKETSLERILSIDVSAIWSRVVWFMRVIVVPGVGVHHACIGKERRIADVLEGVAVIERLERVVGVLNSFNADQFRVLHASKCTDLYFTQVPTLSTCTE